MAEFVRVRAENGDEVSIPEGLAEAAGIKPLNKPALSNDGTVAPTKHRVVKGAASADHTKTEAPASDRPKEG